MELTFDPRHIKITAMIRRFLQENPEQIEAKDKDGNTLLLIAIRANAMPPVLALLDEFGADLRATNNKGEGAIKIAMDSDNIGGMKEILETHLEKRAAISKKNDEAVKVLDASLSTQIDYRRSRKKLVNHEKEILRQLLGNALASVKKSTSSQSISDDYCLTEFGQKNLGEFLGYILNLKLENSVNDKKENIFSAEEIEEVLDKTKITDEDLESRQFFHSFLLEFHKQRALSSSKLENQEVTVLDSNQLKLYNDLLEKDNLNAHKNHKKIFFLEERIKNLTAFLSKETGQKLYLYQNPKKSDRYNADLAAKTTFSGIEVYHSESVGVNEGTSKNPGRAQEDAYIIGFAKNDWQDSTTVPHFLEKKFADLGPKIRSFGDEIGDGSTAIISHYSTDQKLTIANLGDSRAVLFVKKTDGSFYWIRLTNDQEPLDTFEKARIEGNGGFVLKKGKTRNRVNGITMVARSFGDHYSVFEGLDEYQNPNGKKLISYQPDIY